MYLNGWSNSWTFLLSTMHLNFFGYISAPPSSNHYICVCVLIEKWDHIRSNSIQTYIVILCMKTYFSFMLAPIVVQFLRYLTKKSRTCNTKNRVIAQSGCTIISRKFILDNLERSISFNHIYYPKPKTLRLKYFSRLMFWGNCKWFYFSALQHISSFHYQVKPFTLTPSSYFSCVSYNQYSIGFVT